MKTTDERLAEFEKFYASHPIKMLQGLGIESSVMETVKSSMYTSFQVGYMSCQDDIIESHKKINF